MNDLKNCPQCGAPLAQAGTLDGLCAACMLRLDLEQVSAPNPGRTDRTLPSIDEVQRDFPELNILEQVGAGGMGIVYRARQIKLDRVVALKVLLPELAADPAFAERFVREAQALAKLDHPNVVSVYDFGDHGGRFFLMMEFVDGASLREMLDKDKVLLAKALTITSEISLGLAYAHEQGIVHRDIKPENILIDRYGEAKLADFGLVKVLGHKEGDWRLTRVSQIMGTPHYMAPEQMHQPTEVDHRADIYSLGVVLYEMLTGDLPVGRFELPSERAHIDPRLDTIVMKALERDPSDRYQRIREMGDRVAFLLTSGGGNPSQAGGFEASAVGADVPDKIRIPFTNLLDPLFGSEGRRGVLRVSGDALLLEWRIINGWGITTREVRTLRLPFAEIVDAHFRMRWWRRGELTICGNALGFTRDYPEVRPGELRMHMAVEQKDQAMKLCELIRHGIVPGRKE